MSIDWTFSMRDPWVFGLERKDSPLLITPEEFLKRNPSWSMALLHYFNRNSELDCEANRKALALEMTLYILENPQATSNAALLAIMTKERKNQFLSKVRETKSEGVALSILKFLGNLFLNIITCGLYGIFFTYYQKQQIERAEGKNTDKKQIIEEVITRLRPLGEQLAHPRNKDVPTEKEWLEDQNMQIKIQDAKEELHKVEETLMHIQENIFLDPDKAPIPISKKALTPEGGRGWIDPAYALKSSDPLYIPFSGTDEIRALYDSCNTMEDLLKTALETTLASLLSADKKAGISLNRSSQILEAEEGSQQKKYSDTIYAIYKMMAYNLIKQAAVVKGDDDDLVLLLNQEGLNVHASHPFWVKKNEVIFKHHDAWTPPPYPSSNGIDPISIRYLLRELQQLKGDTFLIRLILDPLMHNSNPHLKAAKEMRDKPDRLGEVLRILEPLIHDIAAMFQGRYQADLDPIWEETFSDKSVAPFVKSLDIETIENNQEEEMKKIVVWRPDLLPIAPTHKILIDDLMRTKKILSPIWNSPKPLWKIPRADTKVLKKVKNLSDCSQYWCLHLEIEDQGCLFSALAVSLLQGALQKKDINPKRLKDFLAAYIEGGAGECFATTISAETKGWAWNQYADFLRGKKVNLSRYNLNDRGKALMGDLEIELLCRALEIHVEVFSNNCLYTIENGLMKSTRHYGAINSLERITLYCTNGHSWYALFPKVRAALPQDSFELKAAINTVRQYWKGNNGIELDEWPKFIF